MPTERFLGALTRIEAAARRLEALASTPPPPAPDAALAARHERLRAGAAEALGRLDQLIARAEDGR